MNLSILDGAAVRSSLQPQRLTWPKPLRINSRLQPAPDALAPKISGCLLRNTL